MELTNETTNSFPKTQNQSILLKDAGSREDAWETVERMYRSSPAYRGLMDGILRESGVLHVRDLSWEKIPILTKDTFYNRHPTRDYIPNENIKDTYTLFRSSGTTASAGNQGFLWPQLRSDARLNANQGRRDLARLLHLDTKPTLVIIGSTLGSWAGGEQFSFYFKSMAMDSEFPMAVFTPGKNHAEIVEVIEAQRDFYEQFLIVMVPSAIYYLEFTAGKMGVQLPHEKISYFVSGEPFSEDLRRHVNTRAGRGDALISLYGAADTGRSIGLDCEHLALVRQFLSDHPEVAKRLGIASAPVPNLFHISRNGDYLEVVNGELIITKWQGVPLLRYNLKDRSSIVSWKGLSRALAEADISRRDYWTALSQIDLPDVITVAGRNDGCEFMSGTNLFGPMLEEVVLKSSLGPRATGAFIAWVGYENGRQILSWQIELKPGELPPQGEELNALHAEFVTLLGEQQPEFVDDYNTLYRHYEADGLYVFQFHFCEAPVLTEHPNYNHKIKRKILVDRGPWV